jgi:hypothetical protein
VSTLARATAAGVLPWRCPRCRRRFASGQVTDVRVSRHPTGPRLVFVHSGTCRRPLTLTPRGQHLGFVLCLIGTVAVLVVNGALIWLVTR